MYSTLLISVRNNYSSNQYSETFLLFTENLYTGI